jgi:hypothetical protein
MLQEKVYPVSGADRGEVASPASVEDVVYQNRLHHVYFRRPSSARLLVRLGDDWPRRQ